MIKSIITLGLLHILKNIKLLQILNGRRAFTLVELIVVVSILAILSAVGFVAFAGYLSGVRDTNRVSQIITIHDGLSMFDTKQKLPIPDQNVEVRSNSEVIAWQGYAGDNVLSLIDYSEEGVDQKSGLHFNYYLTNNQKHFQLAAFLEEDPMNLVFSGMKKTHAYDYSDKFIYVYGKKLGILTDAATNTPIQEVVDIVDKGNLDINSTTGSYLTHLANDDIVTGVGVSTLYKLKEVAEVGGRFCSGSGGTTIVCQDPNEELVVSPQPTGGGLYDFTSHTFHPCGRTGSNGPVLSDCTTGTYKYTPSWVTDPAKYLDIPETPVALQGYQFWTVPETGTYVIEIAGAWSTFPSEIYTSQITQREGIKMKGTFSLIKGDQLIIVVGQEGKGIYYSSGGGGGTFVAKADSITPENLGLAEKLIIAGGGGGIYNHKMCGNGLATTSESGNADCSGTNMGGSAGAGGGSNTGNQGSAGGGGFTSNGSSSARAGEEGKSFINGLVGGISSEGKGGFGGGAAGGDVGWSGGGGGGYSGGSGGDSTESGGGGGSYILPSATYKDLTLGGNNGHGYVTITKN